MKKNIVLAFLLTVFVSTSIHCLSERAAELVGAGTVLAIVAGKSAKKLYDNRRSYKQRAKNCAATVLQKFKNSCPIKQILKELAKKQPKKNLAFDFIEKTGCVFVGTWKAGSGCARSLLARLCGAVPEVDKNAGKPAPQK